MPSALPDGETVPDRGPLPAGVRVGSPFGVYVHVPFCASRCGYCDFNTYTELGHLQSSWAETRRRRGALGPRAARAGAGRDGVRRRRHAHAAARRPTSPACCARSTTASAWLPAPRSPPRPTPTRSTPASLAALREAGFTRVSFGMQSRRRRASCACSTARTCPAAPQQAAREARRRRVRAGVARPHLRHAGRDRRRLAALAGRRARGRADARVGVRAHRRGRHRARPRRRPRPAAPAPDDDVLADRYLMAERALGPLGWYEVEQLGRALPAQPRLLARRRLVGRRPRRAQPRRRRALVERQAPGHVDRRRSRPAAPRPPAARCSATRTAGSRTCCCGCACARALPLDLLRPAGLAAAHRVVADGLLELTAGPRGADPARAAARRRRGARPRRLSRGRTEWTQQHRASGRGSARPLP